MKKLSIVIPAFNEERNVEILCSEITEKLKGKIENYEVVFVDDGSKDNTFGVLSEIASHDKKVKVVKHLANVGQSGAIATGARYAKGEVVVTMDSDLQHDPEDIFSLLRKLNQGYDVVCGWRKVRKNSDSFIKKTIPSKISNFLIRSITKTKLHDTTGGMRALKKRVTEEIELYGEMHRYLPILAVWKGFRVSETPINVRKRKYEKTKYRASRLFRGFLDLIAVKYFMSYSTRPLHLFGFLSFILVGLGTIIELGLIVGRLFYGIHITPYLPLFLLGILLIIIGINFFCLGLIGDMISYNSNMNNKQKCIIDMTINV
jgi:glycosyltransferase involved in cell wall biosynthesis